MARDVQNGLPIFGATAGIAGIVAALIGIANAIKLTVVAPDGQETNLHSSKDTTNTPTTDKKSS